MEGVMITILAVNYFGDCKKEVNHRSGYRLIRRGMAGEEHAGGALALVGVSLGDRFLPEQVKVVSANHRLTEVIGLLGPRATFHETGYARGALYPEIHYMPEDMQIDLLRQDVTWQYRGQEQHLKLLPNHIYIHPSGYKVRMLKPLAAPSWRLVGTVPEGAFCHKPCTVSGGGKSEISKSLVDAILPGSFSVRRWGEDMALVRAIVERDYDARPLLSPERSLGSVIKLLTPS